MLQFFRNGSIYALPEEFLLFLFRLKGILLAAAQLLLINWTQERIHTFFRGCHILRPFLPGQNAVPEAFGEILSGIQAWRIFAFQHLGQRNTVNPGKAAKIL